jgi:hypothetical protein
VSHVVCACTEKPVVDGPQLVAGTLHAGSDPLQTAARTCYSDAITLWDGLG